MSKQQNLRGFTIIEVLVAMTIFSIGIIAISGLASAIQMAQRNNQYLNIASIVAKDIIENTRNNNQVDSLQYGVVIQNLNLNDDDQKLLNSLPNGQASLKATFTPGTYGIKNLEVTVTYTVGTDVRTVFMSGYGGAQGIVQ